LVSFLYRLVDQPGEPVAGMKKKDREAPGCRGLLLFLSLNNGLSSPRHAESKGMPPPVAVYMDWVVICVIQGFFLV